MYTRLEIHHPQNYFLATSLKSSLSVLEGLENRLLLRRTAVDRGFAVRGCFMGLMFPLSDTSLLWKVLMRCRAYVVTNRKQYFPSYNRSELLAAYLLQKSTEVQWQLQLDRPYAVGPTFLLAVWLHPYFSNLSLSLNLYRCLCTSSLCLSVCLSLSLSLSLYIYIYIYMYSVCDAEAYTYILT